LTGEHMAQANTWQAMCSTNQTIHNMTNQECQSSPNNKGYKPDRTLTIMHSIFY